MRVWNMQLGVLLLVGDDERWVGRILKKIKSTPVSFIQYE